LMVAEQCCQKVYHVIHVTHQKLCKLHRGSWPGGRRGLSPPAAPGFESSCARLSSPRCLTCPLGLQGVQWAVGLVVVRASWPGHPRKLKKKKKVV